jgi:hypothetical protein
MDIIMPLFIPITKFDIAKQLVYGTISEEILDKTARYWIMKAQNRHF